MTEHWLTVEEVASFLNITNRVVRKNADAGKYGNVKYEENRSRGGNGGKIILIPLSGLPTTVQIAYFRDRGQTLPPNLEDDGWDQEPLWRRNIAAERIRIITAWEKYLASHPGIKRSILTNEFINAWIASNPENNNFSAQTLYRWRQDYRTNGRMALIPGWGESKKGDYIDPQAWAYFDEIYGTLQKRTIGDCYRELQTVAALRGWRIPSLRTIQRTVKRYPKAYWIYRREGERLFEEQCLPYMRRDRDTIRGGEVWVGDCHTFDFFAKGPNGKPVRLILSGWVDMRSVKWLGWHIDYTGGTDPVMAAFARGALDPNIGIPYIAYMDNGREYDNKQFAYGGHRKKTKDKEKFDEARIRSLVVQLGIETIFAIPKNAQAKIIEREFKEVAQRFSKRFETYCGSDNKERPEGLNEILKDPSKLPDLKTVRELFDKWIVVERNQRQCQGQGRKNETPDQVFARTRLPIRRVPESVLRLCFMRHTEPLTVNQQGVWLFDSWYYNDLLIEHLGKKLIARYRNDDLSKVFIFTLDEKFLCEAAMDGMYHATKATKEDFQAHKAIKKQAKERIKQIQSGLDDHGGIMSFPDYLDARAQQAAASAPSPPEPSNVVAMVPVSPELRQSAIAVQKLVVGGDNRPTYEERREAERERMRETMEAIRRSMSMSKTNK